MRKRNHCLLRKLYKKTKIMGFTLIELLVVVSIIALLSSTVLAALNAAREKAYTSRTASDNHTMKVAMDLYYDDHGSFPAIGQSITVYSGNSSWDTLNNYLRPYMSAVVTPPRPTLVVGGWIMIGYVYYKGTASQPISMIIADSAKNNKPVAKIDIREGYFLDFLPGTQSSLTLQDGGIDPDGIDSWGGDVTITKY